MDRIGGLADVADNLVDLADKAVEGGAQGAYLVAGSEGEAAGEIPLTLGDVLQGPLHLVEGLEGEPGDGPGEHQSQHNGDQGAQAQHLLCVLARGLDLLPELLLGLLDGILELVELLAERVNCCCDVWNWLES